MALHWDARKIRDYENIPNSVLDAAIWATLGTGMGEITEKNWREFAARWIVAYDAKSEVEKGQYIAAAQRCIGLSTNVSSESKQKFHNRMGRVRMEDAFRAIERAEATGAPVPVDIEIGPRAPTHPVGPPVDME